MSDKKFVTLIGRAGGDPQLRETRAGDVLGFSVAVPTGYTDADPARWFQVSVWNEGLKKWAKEEIYKGAVIGVEGYATVYEKDGKSYPQVTASNLYLTEKGPRTKDDRSRPRQSAPIEDKELDF